MLSDIVFNSFAGSITNMQFAKLNANCNLSYIVIYQVFSQFNDIPGSLITQIKTFRHITRL